MYYFRDLRVYLHFTYKTSIPMHVSNLILVLKRISLHLPMCVVQGHHLHGLQCSMAVSAHSLSPVSVGKFVLHLSVVVFVKVTLKQRMAMALKRKKLTVSEKVKIIQEVGKNPTVFQNEVAKHSMLPPSSWSNIILQIASVLEEEIWHEALSEKLKTFVLLYEQGSLPYC
jgi:hypothetical protein